MRYVGIVSLDPVRAEGEGERYPEDVVRRTVSTSSFGAPIRKRDSYRRPKGQFFTKEKLGFASLLAFFSSLCQYFRVLRIHAQLKLY